VLLFKRISTKTKINKMARRKTTYKKRNSSYKRRSSTASKRSPPKRKNRLILPWPVIGFLLLAVGVLLIGLTLKSVADESLQVKAKVPAPLPTVPAVITSPADGVHFKTKPITVKGTCPTENYPGNYVVLYRNDTFSGTVPCSSDDTFQLDTDLFDGANELKAQIYTIADDPGPAPMPITVFFDPAQPTLPGGSSSLVIPQFLISTNFKFKSYLVGQTVNWEMNATGGEPPYAIKVDWGDGQSSLVSRSGEGSFTIQHVYKKAAEAPDFIYLIKVTAADVYDRQALTQFFVRVLPYNAPFSVGTSGNPKTPVGKSNPLAPIGRTLLKAAWPAYIIVSLMALSFWLGEQEEFFLLRKKRAIKKYYT
jgi:hypothetical protein